MNYKVEKVDCILTLGSNDLRVAEKSAQLFLEGFAPVLIFSGGLGRLTLNLWTEPEALKFAHVAIKLGVPEDKIILESNSTNTGENIRFTKQLLTEKKIFPNSFILVQKPYMEKRAYATFIKHWPGRKAISTSPQISFDDYTNNQISLEVLIHALVGEFQRMLIYPDKGFQEGIPVSEEAILAFEYLKKQGFVAQLV